MTEEQTDTNKEMRGQGIANFIAGFFGGMAGCALVAESVLSMKMGGRHRLSTLVAALFLLPAGGRAGRCACFSANGSTCRHYADGMCGDFRLEIGHEHP